MEQGAERFFMDPPWSSRTSIFLEMPEALGRSNRGSEMLFYIESVKLSISFLKGSMECEENPADQA